MMGGTTSSSPAGRAVRFEAGMDMDMPNLVKHVSVDEKTSWLDLPGDWLDGLSLDRKGDNDMYLPVHQDQTLSL